MKYTTLLKRWIRKKSLEVQIFKMTDFSSKKDYDEVPDPYYSRAEWL